MKVPTKQFEDKPRELVPAGPTVARCYIFADLGDHESTYQGKTAISRKIIYMWELESLMSDGRPFSISQEYNANLWPGTAGGQKGNPSGLYSMLASWGVLTPDKVDSFDPASVVGKTCMINVVHKPDATDPKKIWANVGSISPVHPKMPVPDPVNDPIVYDPTADPSTLVNIEKLPKWIQKKIQDQITSVDSPSSTDDDVPF